MANEYTPRFQWPIPPWNADWQKWQAQFKAFAQGADATVFAVMEHVTVLPRDLPVVELVVVGPTEVTFTPAGTTRFLSRTAQTEITVSATPLTITDASIGALVCADLQPGAVGPQAVDWELYAGSTPVDPSIVPFGVVHDDLTILWFNGNALQLGVPTILFGGGAGSGATFLSGAGNPNVLGTTATAGTSYLDTVTGLIYMNVDSATTWVLT